MTDQSKSEDINISNLSDREVIDLMKSDHPLNKARLAFSQEYAEIDTAYRQRVTPTPVEMRRMEFKAAQRILKALNTTPDSKTLRAVNSHYALVAALKAYTQDDKYWNEVVKPALKLAEAE